MCSSDLATTAHPFPTIVEELGARLSTHLTVEPMRTWDASWTMALAIWVRWRVVPTMVIPTPTLSAVSVVLVPNSCRCSMVVSVSAPILLAMEINMSKWTAQNATGMWNHAHQLPSIVEELGARPSTKSARWKLVRRSTSDVSLMMVPVTWEQCAVEQAAPTTLLPFAAQNAPGSNTCRCSTEVNASAQIPSKMEISMSVWLIQIATGMWNHAHQLPSIAEILAPGHL